MIRFGAWSIVLLIGAVQGLFVSIGLSLRPINRPANFFLSGLIFLLSLKLVPYIIGYAGFYEVYPWLDLAPFDLSLGFGPLLYLYFSRLTAGRRPTRWAIHLIPLAGQFLIYLALFIQPLGFKQRFEDTVGPAFNTADNLLDCLSFSVYVVLTWRDIGRYERNLSERFSNPDLHRLKPLRQALAFLTVTFAAFVGAKLWTIFIWPLSYYQMFPFYLLLTSVVYAFGFVAFQFAQVDLAPPSEVVESKDVDWTAVAAQFDRQLADLTFWRDPLLSVATAAKALGVSETRLSKAINVGLGISFSTWINRYRIEQVARRLVADDKSVSVFEIAQECGFNSKATFNRWFREVKGCTPTEFRLSQLTPPPDAERHPVPPQYPPAKG